MKVVHITTSTSGGAGIAALRTSRALKSLGWESSILCLHQHLMSKPDDVQCVNPFKPTILQKVLFRLGISKTKGYQQAKAVNDNKKYCGESYSLPLSDYRLDLHPAVQNADLIHLHWVSHFVDYPTFFAHIHKPIIWTFHDMNPFLNGYHYQGDQNRFASHMQKLEHQIAATKDKSIQKTKNLGIIFPSQWLQNEAAFSPRFRFFKQCVVPNCIPSPQYSHITKEECRITLGLTSDDVVFLFVSEKIENPRKGFDLLQKALSLLPTTQKITLVTMGKPVDFPKLNIPIVQLGLIHTEKIIAMAYRAADAFLITSREDNCPNVVLESLSYGTPVIATPAGGIPELIQPLKTGLISSEITATAYAEQMLFFLQNRTLFQMEKISKETCDTFSESNHAQAINHFYKQFLQPN